MEIIVQDNKDKSITIERLHAKVSLLRIDYTKKEKINKELNFNTKTIKQDLDEKQEFISELKHELKKKNDELIKVRSATKKTISDSKKVIESQISKKEIIRNSDSKVNRQSKSTSRKIIDFGQSNEFIRDNFIRDSADLHQSQFKQMQLEIDDLNTHKNNLQNCLDKKTNDTNQYTEIIKKNEIHINKLENDVVV